MNLRSVAIVLAAAAAVLPMSAVAEGAPNTISPYIEGSYAWPQLNTDGYSVTPSVGLVRVGVDFNRYWALEGVGAFGISSANVDLVGVPVSVKVSSGYGVYVKGLLPVASHFELFARAGWLRATLDASAYGSSASSSDSSFSYGAGFQIPFGGGWYAQGDYMSYYNKNGETVRGPSVGVGYRF